LIDKEQFLEPLLAGDTDAVVALTREALGAGNSPDSILRDGLLSAMGVIGQKFKDGDVYLPELFLSARSMRGTMTVLGPLLSSSEAVAGRKVVIGSVEGDLHDIGKNLVTMMMEIAGIEVVDLGIDIPAATFVEAVRIHKPAFVAMSALLTTTMAEMELVIAALKDAGLREDVHVIVGGAPVTEGFAREIGADGYAPDAASVMAVLDALA